jgi:hypothetical protein
MARRKHILPRNFNKHHLDKCLFYVEREELELGGEKEGKEMEDQERNYGNM